MKRFAALFIAFVWMLNLVGCGVRDEEKELYRTDTVIYIPAEPTETVTEIVTEPSAAGETEVSSEAETTEETVPETTKAAANKTSSSTKKSTSSSSSSSGKKPATNATTEPATEATTAPATEATTEPTTAPTTEPPTEATTEPVTEATTEPTVPETTSEPVEEETTEATTIPEETAPSLYDISGYEVGKLEKAMMKEINRYRNEENLEELRKSSKLSAIASARAYEAMLQWSHTRPDGSDYTTVFRDYGYNCTISAENLIYTTGGEDAAALISRWMDAEGNRNDLMNPDFTHVGVGIYQADGYVYIACLLAG